MPRYLKVQSHFFTCHIERSWQVPNSLKETPAGSPPDPGPLSPHPVRPAPFAQASPWGGGLEHRQRAHQGKSGRRGRGLKKGRHGPWAYVWSLAVGHNSGRRVPSTSRVKQAVLPQPVVPFTAHHSWSPSGFATTSNRFGTTTLESPLQPPAPSSTSLPRAYGKAGMPPVPLMPASLHLY